jgi:hypothetical protein
MLPCPTCPGCFHITRTHGRNVTVGYANKQSGRFRFTLRCALDLVGKRFSLSRTNRGSRRRLNPSDGRTRSITNIKNTPSRSVFEKTTGSSGMFCGESGHSRR